MPCIRKWVGILAGATITIYLVCPPHAHVNGVVMSDWDEVRKLAADFQHLQATAGTNRLSERNCIELVSRLIQMGQIDVVYTLDGKEYVTPKHLEKEIKDELLVHRGRQSL